MEMYIAVAALSICMYIKMNPGILIGTVLAIFLMGTVTLFEYKPEYKMEIAELAKYMIWMTILPLILYGRECTISYVKGAICIQIALIMDTLIAELMIKIASLFKPKKKDEDRSE